MVFLGLVVALAAVGAGVFIVLDNPGTAHLSMMDNSVPGITTVWQVFLAGVVVAIVFIAGVTIAAFGIGRAVRLRHELRELREEHEESVTTLEMEKRRLQRELARVKQGTTGQPKYTQDAVAPR